VIMITNWIVRGVNANAHDVWQLGVQAKDPFTALELAVITLRGMKEMQIPGMISGDYTASGRMNGDNYEPPDIPPDWDKLNSIVGWRVEPVRKL
jgi:hypothetical protein